MEPLTVSASFIVGDRGKGPDLMVLVSACDADGSPTVLTIPDDADQPWPITIFVGLSEFFGTDSIPCEITGIEALYPPPAGYYAVTVKAEWNDIGTLQGMHPYTLGVIVDTGSARGQALATLVGPSDLPADIG